MQLNITGQNVEITEALRDFVNTKFAKLEQYFERINQVYIVLKVEGNFMPVRKGKTCTRLSTA